MMVGNSLASDIIPMIEAGGRGAFVPFELTWELEQARPPQDHMRFHQIDNLSELLPLLRQVA